MALIKKNTNNTQPQIVSHTEGSIFPNSQLKSSGAGFTNQNLKTGEFKGKLKALRPIQSKNNQTVFAVIDIEVPGEQGLFQDFLNFNTSKEEKSVSYLVNHTKSLVSAAGYEADPEEEKDLAWVEATITQLIEEQAEVAFRQTENKNRQVSIAYL